MGDVNSAGVRRIRCRGAHFLRGGALGCHLSEIRHLFRSLSVLVDLGCYVSIYNPRC